MDKIYLKDNYIVAEVGGETSVFSKFYASYYETSTHFFITNIIGQSYVRTLSIDLTDIPNFYNEAGTTAYTITTLRTFLRLNTGFKSPSGGSGGVSDGNKGDITVSGGGAVWDINALAVDDAKISDVDATKVTTNPIQRFVTDTDLTVLSNTSGTNSGDETTSSIKTKLGAATGLLDGYLTASDWDIFNGKQPVLISGTNIKTIGGISILGAGNLPIPDPAGWTTIVKSANEDVTNNATLQDDTELQFSVVAGGHYMVEMNICYSGNNTTGDYKYGFSVSTGLMRMRGISVTYGTTGAPTLNAITANNTATTGSIGIGVLFANLDELHTTTATLNFYADTNATFKFQFANNTAAAGRISRTWKGSILKYKRID